MILGVGEGGKGGLGVHLFWLQLHSSPVARFLVDPTLQFLAAPIPTVRSIGLIDLIGTAVERPESS